MTIYTLKDKQVWLGQNILNVYYYEQATGEGKAEELAIAFRDLVIPEIVTVQNVALTHVEIEVQNPQDEQDFIILPINPAIAGADSGNNMPPFVCWEYKRPRDRVTIRNGRFALGGVTATLVADGVATAGAKAELDALAESLGTPLDDGAGNTWVSGYFATPSGQTQPIFVPVPLPTYQRVSSQNSRKFGVGQ